MLSLLTSGVPKNMFRLDNPLEVLRAQAIKLTVYYSRKTQISILAKGKGVWGSVQERSKHRDSWGPFSVESRGQRLLLPAPVRDNTHGVLPARLLPEPLCRGLMLGSSTLACKCANSLLIASHIPLAWPGGWGNAKFSAAQRGRLI